MGTVSAPPRRQCPPWEKSARGVAVELWRRGGTGTETTTMGLEKSTFVLDKSQESRLQLLSFPSWSSLFMRFSQPCWPPLSPLLVPGFQKPPWPWRSVYLAIWRVYRQMWRILVQKWAVQSPCITSCGWAPFQSLDVITLHTPLSKNDQGVYQVSDQTRILTFTGVVKWVTVGLTRNGFVAKSKEHLGRIVGQTSLSSIGR